ncbi:hypothetical protein ACFE04_021145 [Oxalis oulophora]
MEDQEWAPTKKRHVGAVERASTPVVVEPSPLVIVEPSPIFDLPYPFKNRKNKIKAKGDKAYTSLDVQVVPVTSATLPISTSHHVEIILATPTPLPISTSQQSIIYPHIVAITGGDDGDILSAILELFEEEEDIGLDKFLLRPCLTLPCQLPLFRSEP